MEGPGISWISLHPVRVVWLGTWPKKTPPTNSPETPLEASGVGHAMGDGSHAERVAACD